jgi:competence ComEA-like helix-hairpin-helix protein
MGRTDGTAIGTVILLAAALAWTPGLLVESAHAAQTASAATATPDPDPAAQTFQRICSNCHTPERILASRRTRVGWEEVLDLMATKGARATDDEWGQIEDYVLRHYGRVNVNRAPADEMALILGVSDEQAASIVGYRKAQGTFVDFDSLVKVPGLDGAKLDQERDAITF